MLQEDALAQCGKPLLPRRQHPIATGGGVRIGAHLQSAGRVGRNPVSEAARAEVSHHGQGAAVHGGGCDSAAVGGGRANRLGVPEPPSGTRQLLHRPHDAVRG